MSDYNKENSELRRRDDIVLEKVIKLIEDTLRSLHEIKNKLDINDRDHSDVKQQINTIVTVVYEMLNRMKQATNEKIIDLLEKNEDVHVDLSYRMLGAEKFVHNIYEKMQDIENIKDELNGLNRKLDEIKDNSVNTYRSFTLIQKLLGVLLIVISAVTIVSAVWNSMQDRDFANEVKVIIEKELESYKN